MWDFWSLSPESLHQVTILMSDRGLPTDLRHMNGYGSHTYSLINAKNERFWVKFHFKTMQGHKHLDQRRSRAGGRQDPRIDAGAICSARIERGDFPRWRFCVQIMPEADAAKTPYNPFDLTKVWPHKDYPLIEVGVMELNRNPDNYFAEIEQAAFTPSNIVPGIGFSPDKMLQARIFSYADAHRYRLGTHYEALPVNAPKCPVHNYHEDGAMRFFANKPNTDAYYEPNCFSGPASSRMREPPLKISGDADRYNHREGRQSTTTCRCAPCSICSTPARGSACSPTSPTPWRACRKDRGAPDRAVREGASGLWSRRARGSEGETPPYFSTAVLK